MIFEGNHTTVKTDALVYWSHEQPGIRPESDIMNTTLLENGFSLHNKVLLPLSNNTLLNSYQMERKDQWLKSSMLWAQDSVKPILLDGWGQARHVIVCPCPNVLRQRIDLGSMQRHLRIIYSWATALKWKRVLLASSEFHRDILSGQEGSILKSDWGSAVDLGLLVHSMPK
jgi:hypothetical protein